MARWKLLKTCRVQMRELLNLQNRKGQAKPYQIRQFLQLIEDYNLDMGDES